MKWKKMFNITFRVCNVNFALRNETSLARVPYQRDIMCSPIRIFPMHFSMWLNIFVKIFHIIIITEKLHNQRHQLLINSIAEKHSISENKANINANQEENDKSAMKETKKDFSCWCQTQEWSLFDAVHLSSVGNANDITQTLCEFMCNIFIIILSVEDDHDQFSCSYFYREPACIQVQKMIHFFGIYLRKVKAQKTYRRFTILL